MELTSPQQSVLEDQAFRLGSRGVLCLRGERVLDAIQPLVTISLDEVPKKAVLAHIVDNEGFLLIDLFIISYQGALLIEIDKSVIPKLIELLAAHCEACGVTVQDVSSEWNVFAELPDQKTFDDGSEYIRYVDPRWHMGARILRPTGKINSSRWGSEIKWETHAFKLGFLPSTTYLKHVPISPLEAGLHALNLLHMDRLPNGLQAAMSSPEDKLKRRLLPMRIEPNSDFFPTMNGGLSVLAGDVEIGKAIGHHGLFALAVIELELWRHALVNGTPLHSGGQSVLITWPSWLAHESRGRGGPVAMSKRS